MQPISAGLNAQRARLRSIAVAAAVAVLAAFWFAGPWSSLAMRDADFERLAGLERAGGALAPLLSAWGRFAGDATALAVVVGAMQVACCLCVLYVAWRATRSSGIAVVAALLSVASPLPEHWLARPSGFADAVTAVALAAAFGCVLDGVIPERGRAAIATVGALGGTLVSGWACIPLAILALCTGRRLALPLGGGAALALAVRAAIGVPLATVLGRFDWYGPHALIGLRLCVFATFATPAALFVARAGRPVIMRSISGAQIALSAAAIASLLGGEFLVSHWCALFIAQLALTIAVLPALRGAPARVSGMNAAIAIGAIAIAGLLLRPQPPPDDRAVVARERMLVRGAAPSFIVVDHADPTIRARYSADHLAYVAGRPVDVQYRAAVPDALTIPVLDAGGAGLERIDDVIRAVGEVKRARNRVTYDVMQRSADGIMSSRAPQSTPSGFGVIPKLPLPGLTDTIDAIVVVSGFSDTFENVPVRPGDRLVYLVAKALPAGNAARGMVTVDVPGMAPIVLHDDVPPAPSAGPLRWRVRSVTLPVRRLTSARIRFAASSPSGANLGDWVAFGLPAIVRR